MLPQSCCQASWYRTGSSICVLGSRSSASMHCQQQLTISHIFWFNIQLILSNDIFTILAVCYITWYTRYNVWCVIRWLVGGVSHERNLDDNHLMPSSLLGGFKWRCFQQEGRNCFLGGAGGIIGHHRIPPPLHLTSGIPTWRLSL